MRERRGNVERERTGKVKYQGLKNESRQKDNFERGIIFDGRSVNGQTIFLGGNISHG